MDIEYILNDALNKALITDRIKGVPSSNKIADFVSKYIESEQLILPVVIPSLGVAKFIKNPKGNSSIKDLTLGKEYRIIKRFSREEQRKYRSDFCDGFEIIKDNGKSAIYFSEAFFEVNWV